MSSTQPILEVRNLEKTFKQSTGILDLAKERLGLGENPPIRAVDGVDLRLEQNQAQAVIGESGCGKTTLLKTLMGLYSPTGGDVVFDGTNRDEFSKADWKEFRRRVPIIFQDPFNSINPTFTVRDALLEPLGIHDMKGDDPEGKAIDALEKARLTPAETYLDRRESELSGGEKQRVSIARALILDPDVLLADEPTSMIDVSTQASLLNLLDDLVEELGLSMLYVSHDLSTVSYVCDRINVMYLGRVIESGTTDAVLDNPKHPYTQALIQAIPVPDPFSDREPTDLRGTPSDPINLPGGCRFKDRCPERMDVCDRTPRSMETEDDAEHTVACHLYYDHEGATGADGHATVRAGNGMHGGDDR